MLDNDQNLIEVIMSYDWIIPASGYTLTRTGTNDIAMHQFIMRYTFGNNYVPRKENGNVIDHLNNNSLDNRIRNLHILSQRDNNDKKALDFNCDNLTVYIEYELDFSYISSLEFAYSQEELDKKYQNRKYILSYISKDILFTTEDNQGYFNCFELVYDEYYKFIKDVKSISIKTKEIWRVQRLQDKKPYHGDLKKIKTYADIKLNKDRKEKQNNALIKLLNNKNWIKIRNLKNNMVTNEELNSLSEKDKHFYLTVEKTAFQYLPKDFN